MTQIHPASSLDLIQPSKIREVANVAFTMEGVFRLHFGEANIPTPSYIKEAAAEAINAGYTFYSENAGLPSLRRALATKTAELHNVEIDPIGEMVVCSSGVQALNLMIRGTINPGDEAIVLTPNWPNGTEIIKLYGATPVEVPFQSDGQRFRINFAALKTLSHLRPNCCSILHRRTHWAGWRPQKSRMGCLPSVASTVCG
ncbi:MAG: aminotransferase class I/II-fold pyridoxal phosphate-dependent enzyme [Caldilineaceae bacterium]